MTPTEFNIEYMRRKENTFGDNPPEATHDKLSDGSMAMVGIKHRMRIGGRPFCEYTVISNPDYTAVIDVVWLMPEPEPVREPGQPCLAFKGINKFLRKREIAP